MKCFFYFECVFEDDLESPMFTTYYGPIIKEDNQMFVIENHAENSTIFHQSIFGKIGLGDTVFASPSDVINKQNIVPHHHSFRIDDNHIENVYILSFFFEDSDKSLINDASKKCKEACLKEYKRLLKEKIDILTSKIQYVEDTINTKMNDF